MADYITVKGTGDDNRVVLYERDPAHPANLDKDGKETSRPHEAFVVNDGKAVKVGETAEVKRLIGEGKLEKVNGVKTALFGDKEPAKK